MEISKLSKLTTESRNESTVNIDKVSTLEMVEMINNEDQKVALAVEKEKENIAKAIDLISDKLSEGGRLIYVGAGTSGRLGILDASECPPTYGVDEELVQGIIAGGYEAIFRAIEGAEDSKELAKKDLIEKNLSSKDVVCGIAASGRTPYVIGAMEYAKSINASVICVTMNKQNEMRDISDVPICVEVGPEVVMGSTRMKSGTAQKLVLNMLSTGAMIRLGKVYGNLMVDVQASNEKLVARAKRIVMMATEISEEVAENYLAETDYNVKLSIVMIKANVDKNKAEDALNKSNGRVHEAINILK